MRAYEEASHSGRVTALPGARETLEALAQAGVRRALVCDTGLTPGRVVRRHLANLGLLDLLEVLVFSDEVGVPKPDPRTFQAALDPLGVPPAQALHVGDLRHTDILGARSLGMVSVRIRARYDDTSALPEADFVVDSQSRRAPALRRPPVAARGSPRLAHPLCSAAEMESRLDFRIRPQPDGTTCGPTCLHAIYEFYGDAPPLEQIAAEVPQLEDGGTLEVLLGIHALRRGYRARLYTYNLKLFDPTWFAGSDLALAEKLRLQMKVKTSRRLQLSSRAHLEFLKLGGEIRFEDLTHELLRRPLRKGTPIITGLSATYLYGCAREVGVMPEYDDVRGSRHGALRRALRLRPGRARRC